MGRVERYSIWTRWTPKQSQTPHRVELAAPAGEKNGAALHLNLCKRFVGKGRQPFGVYLVCSLEACERGFVRHPRGSERNHFSCSRGVNRSGFISCSKKVFVQLRLCQSLLPSALACPLTQSLSTWLRWLLRTSFLRSPSRMCKKSSLSELEPAINLAQFVERLTSLGERSLREWGASVLLCGLL